MKFMEKAKRFFTLNAANHEGFTLVELIVVIAILAILAGVAVPAYSGYIKKAEKAGDMQLLGALNEAFAAACMAEGTQATAISNAALAWNGNAVEGIASVSGGGVTVTAINESFQLFYQGNETSEFKVLAGKLVFANGVFGEMSEGASNLLDAILNNSAYQPAIGALKDSAFNTIGYDVLAGQINNASSMMAELAGNPTSGFSALIMGEDNENVFYDYVGDDADAVIEAKMAQLQSEYPEKSFEEIETMAITQLYANTAILTAAQNASAIDDDFIASLSNGDAVTALRNSTDGGDATSETIAQAAFAYAMYTSYQASKGVDVSGEVNLMDVYATLESDDFKNNYVNSDAFNKDKDGYMGAMNLIVGSANNADNSMANDILLNGFNSNELVALMQGITK